MDIAKLLNNKFIPFCVFSSVLIAQDVDARWDRKVILSVLADVTIPNIKEIKVEHKLVQANSYWRNTQPTAIYDCVSGTLKNNEDLANCLSQTFGSSGTALNIEVSMIATGVDMLIGVLQGMNTQNRVYAFVAPVDGNYTLTVRMTGDWDKPRNKVIITGSNYYQQLDDDNPSSNRTRTYNVLLSKGAYSLIMALGTGSSALFHNAGTLESVLFYDPTNPKTIFLQNYPIVSTTFNLIQDCPFVGATKEFDLPYNLNFTMPNITISDPKIVTNVHFDPNIHLNSEFVALSTSEKTGTYTVSVANASYYQSPLLTSSGSAKFFIQRAPDTTITRDFHPPIRQKTLEPTSISRPAME